MVTRDPASWWLCWAYLHVQGCVIGREDARLTSSQERATSAEEKLLAQARPDEHFKKQNTLEK
jgi:hypothetical protein